MSVILGIPANTGAAGVLIVLYALVHLMAAFLWAASRILVCALLSSVVQAGAAYVVPGTNVPV